MSYKIELILRRTSGRTEFGILEGASHQDLWLSHYYIKVIDLIDRSLWKLLYMGSLMQEHQAKFSLFIYVIRG